MSKLDQAEQIRIWERGATDRQRPLGPTQKNLDLLAAM